MNNDKTYIREMRGLCARGVTHFVVTDSLYNQLRAELDERSARMMEDIGPMDGEECLFFRGGRVLRQSDLRHLPFNVSPHKSEAQLAYESPDNELQSLLVKARAESRRMLHEYIGVEHLLLAVARSNISVSLPGAREATLKRLQDGVDGMGGTSDYYPLTPRLERVIQFAAEEARAMKQERIRADHYLLGLLREQEGTAAEVLRELGVTLEETRRAVEAALAPAAVA